MTQTGFRTEKCFLLLLCSKCLLCPPGDADWSLGPGWTSERTSKRTNGRAREREREKEKIEGGNRSEQGTSPPDAHWCRDRPDPWPEHTLLPHRGARRPRRSGKTGELGSEVRGQTDRSLSFLSVAWDDKKKTTVWTREWTTKTTEHLTGRLTARQTGRPDERITSRRGKSYSYLGVEKPASGHNLHETSERYGCFFLFWDSWSKTGNTKLCSGLTRRGSSKTETTGGMAKF